MVIVKKSYNNGDFQITNAETNKRTNTATPCSSPPPPPPPPARKKSSQPVLGACGKKFRKSQTDYMVYFGS